MATIDPTGRIYFERNGILVHIPSGMKFPARVGAFERDGLPLVHDRLGYNVGVGYGGDGQMLADFRGIIGDVLCVQPGATLVSEGEETLTGAEGIVKGRRARFRIPQRIGISVSETMSVLNALGYPRAE